MPHHTLHLRPPPHRWRRLAVIGAILSLTLGCGSKGEGGAAKASADASTSAATPERASVVLTGVKVIDGTPEGTRPASLDAAALEAQVRSAMEAAGFVMGDPPQRGWKARAVARVVYGLTTGDGLLEAPAPGAKAKAVWMVEVKFKEADTYDNQYAIFEGADEQPLAEGAALSKTLMARSEVALGRIGEALKGRIEVLTLAREALEARLGDEIPAVRMAVVDRLAALGEKEAVPALVARLKAEPEREIKLRIVGALEELKDPRAEEALMDLANPRDREMLVAVVLALAALDSPRAKDFLDILASHDAPDVRALVEEARRQMEAKAPRPAP